MFDKLSKFVKDLYYTQQRKPDEPESEITYQRFEEVKETVMFPDGVELKLIKSEEDWWIVENRPYINIHTVPDFSTWKEPMKELWLLLVKDRKNWTINKRVLSVCEESTEVLMHLYHKGLDITLREDILYFTKWFHKEWNITGVGMTKSELQIVMRSFELYKYTDKMLRLERINKIRATRIENEKRTNDAKRIREYLNANK